MAADPRSATGDEKLDAEFLAIAGMPATEHPVLLHALSAKTGMRLEALGTLFRHSLVNRRQADEKFAGLKLRTYLETHRPDIAGEDDGEGGLIISCPLGSGDKIVVRDASLIGTARPGRSGDRCI